MTNTTLEDNYKGTTEQFVLHFNEQFRQLEEISDPAEHFPPQIKLQLLQNAVRPIDDLRIVETLDEFQSIVFFLCSSSGVFVDAVKMTLEEQLDDNKDKGGSTPNTHTATTCNNNNDVPNKHANKNNNNNDSHKNNNTVTAVSSSPHPPVPAAVGGVRTEFDCHFPDNDTSQHHQCHCAPIKLVQRLYEWPPQNYHPF